MMRVDLVLALLLLSVQQPRPSGAVVRFESPTRIECTGLEATDLVPTIYGGTVVAADNCDQYVEGVPELCTFTWGDGCEGTATVFNCDVDDDSGNPSTIRYTYIPLSTGSSSCPGTYAECGDTCSGVDGLAFFGKHEIFCPTSSSEDTNSTCSLSIDHDILVAPAVSITSSENGTMYVIKSSGIGAVCDEECTGLSTSTSHSSPLVWNNARVMLCLLPVLLGFVQFLI